MKFKLFCVLFAGLFFLQPSFAAKKRIEQCNQRGVLTVGTTGDYPPFTAINPKTKRRSGFDIDSARDLAKSLHLRPVFIPTTWATLKADTQANKFDIAMGGITITPDRQDYGLMSDAYFDSGKIPFVRCADVEKYSTIDAIDQPSVTVIENRGGTNEAFARSHFKRAKLIFINNNLDVFSQLENRTADVMITEVVEARYQHRYHPSLCAVHPEEPFIKSQLGYLLPKNRAALLRAVNAWLANPKTKKRANGRRAHWMPGS